jgi:hypothetical protein
MSGDDRRPTLELESSPITDISATVSAHDEPTRERTNRERVRRDQWALTAQALMLASLNDVVVNGAIAQPCLSAAAGSGASLCGRVVGSSVAK